MRTLLLSLTAATGLAIAAGAAQSPAPGAFTTGADGSIYVSTPKGTVCVLPVADDIFCVTRLPQGTPAPQFLRSQSAVLEPEAPGVKITATPATIFISSPVTTASVDRRTGKVSFLNSNGSLLLAEAGGVDNSDPDIKTVSLLATEGDNYYGAGERGHRMRLNGDSLSMYNRQNYGYTAGDPRISQMGISVPYIVSDRGYGILFDDHTRASLQLGSDTLLYRAESPFGLSYYFIDGEGDMAGATEGLTRLTGRQHLPPLWTLGYITSKYGYRTQAEAEGVIDTLKTRGYPVDGMVLDLYWYGKEEDMGRLEWNKEQWPDHRKMLSDLKTKGVNMVLISQPYINKQGAIDNYNILAAGDMLTRDDEGRPHDVTTWVGEAGMFDVSNPATRAWYWDRYRDLTSEGVAGWWGDLGEPEVHPSTIRHANGMTAEQYHNVYGNEWSRIIHEGLRKDYPDMRPMLMMRGGTAGLQRYGVFPWTTDVSRSWGGFVPQINLMLSAGLSGLGYMSSDVGGFAVDPAHPTDEELYVRWLQMGAFTPMLRTHSTVKAEPYHYPASEDILKKYIKMRYEWLPYNYTLAYENASQGLPLARPLNFRGDTQEKYSDVQDEYLWGDDVLVAPVLTKGARQRKVLFPEGHWIDWWNPSLSYRGGTTATVKAPLDRLPLFVRRGAFIPQYDRPIDNVTQYDPSTLTVKFFPAKEWTEYTLFDDDRKSPTSLEDGAYQLTTFSGCDQGGEVHIRLSSSGNGYEGMPPFRQLTFEVIGVKKPKTVTASNGVPMPECVSVKAIRQSGWSYDAATRTLWLRLPWEYGVTELTAK
ncbi:MAG: DUF5110 domain-containing protein [Muribaculaceae bacterium]|nr:DUF5110 domain-containing protein [Muribaculaceae bacterium]